MASESRKKLKDKFVRNAVPTEQDFKDLIDAPLNQNDDGIFRNPGEPLCIVARTDAQRLANTNEQKRALGFFGDAPAGSAQPDWLISLNPGPGSNNPGFGIADRTGDAKLFIDASGKVGIGTTKSRAKLEIAGDGGTNIDLLVNGRLKSGNNDGGLWIADDRFVGGLAPNKVGFYSGRNWRLTVQSDGKVGIGTTTPTALLTVAGGAIMPAAGNIDDAGILFPSDPGGGSGDKAWIRYYGRPQRAGTNDTLERMALVIGVANDGPNSGNRDDILLMPSGGVGIGNENPDEKLDVDGRVRAGGLTMGPWPAATNPGDYAFIGSNREDQGNAANYALLVGVGRELGTTYLNASNLIGLRIGNTQQVTVANGAVPIGSVTKFQRTEKLVFGRLVFDVEEFPGKGSFRIGDWEFETAGKILKVWYIQQQYSDLTLDPAPTRLEVARFDATKTGPARLTFP